MQKDQEKAYWDKPITQTGDIHKDICVQVVSRIWTWSLGPEQFWVMRGSFGAKAKPATWEWPVYAINAFYYKEVIRTQSFAIGYPVISCHSSDYFILQGADHE
jgi:hypothetical protein